MVSFRIQFKTSDIYRNINWIMHISVSISVFVIVLISIFWGVNYVTSGSFTHILMQNCKIRFRLLHLYICISVFVFLYFCILSCKYCGCLAALYVCRYRDRSPLGTNWRPWNSEDIHFPFITYLPFIASTNIWNICETETFFCPY